MALREYAVRRGMHVSEYGVEDDTDGAKHTCATEQEVYALLGLDYIEPELREGRGELQAAIDRHAADLITRGQTCGRPALPHDALRRARHPRADGDGGAEARLLVPGVTDHSATFGFGNDVQADALERQVEEIRELNAGMRRLPAAGGLRGQHPARRLARLRRRGARRSSTGSSLRFTPRSAWARSE